jgi:hypothetical protein
VQSPSASPFLRARRRSRSKSLNDAGGLGKGEPAASSSTADTVARGASGRPGAALSPSAKRPASAEANTGESSNYLNAFASPERSMCYSLDALARGEGRGRAAQGQRQVKREDPVAAMPDRRREPSCSNPSSHLTTAYSRIPFLIRPGYAARSTGRFCGRSNREEADFPASEFRSRVNCKATCRPHNVALS